MVSLDEFDLVDIVKEIQQVMCLCTDTIEIYGVLFGGVRFFASHLVKYNPARETIEEAIAKLYGCKARNFDEMVTELSWREAYWTYKN